MATVQGGVILCELSLCAPRVLCNIVTFWRVSVGLQEFSKFVCSEPRWLLKGADGKSTMKFSKHQTGNSVDEKDSERRYTYRYSAH